MQSLVQTCRACSAQHAQHSKTLPLPVLYTRHQCHPSPRSSSLLLAQRVVLQYSCPPRVAIQVPPQLLAALRQAQPLRHLQQRLPTADVLALLVAARGAGKTAGVAAGGAASGSIATSLVHALVARTRCKVLGGAASWGQAGCARCRQKMRPACRPGALNVQAPPGTHARRAPRPCQPPALALPKRPARELTWPAAAPPWPPAPCPAPEPAAAAGAP